MEHKPACLFFPRKTIFEAITLSKYNTNTKKKDKHMELLIIFKDLRVFLLAHLTEADLWVSLLSVHSTVDLVCDALSW